MTSFPRQRRLLISLLVALASAVLGAAIMALLDPFGSPGPLSLLTGHGSPRQPLDAQRVYNRLLPSVLDITAALRYDDETAEGTGFVIDGPRALVLTNNHVIKDATSITASLASTGKTYSARVVGTNTAADIAVLQIQDPPRLIPAPLGDSGTVGLGDQVLVLGNQAGQGGPPTIAPGIINSLNRTIDAADGGAGFTETLHHMLQTSAQIEPGDSGGPLVDSVGRVVGVDTAASTGAGTAGFAIPLNSALAAARQITAGRPGPGVTLGTGAFLGLITVPDARPMAKTAIVSGAHRAVLARGDDPYGVDPQSSPGTPRTPAPPTARSARGGPLRAIAEPGRRHGAGRGAGPSAETSCVSTTAQAVIPERVAPTRYGVLVEGILCGTPAADSGLAPGDAIIRAAGRATPTPGALASVIAGCEPGTRLSVTWVDQAGSTRTALIRVIAAPAP